MNVGRIVYLQYVVFRISSLYCKIVLNVGVVV